MPEDMSTSFYLNINNMFHVTENRESVTFSSFYSLNLTFSSFKKDGDALANEKELKSHKNKIL